MSEKINDGGPAFPDCDGQTNYTGGLTVRDYFAANAMQGELACQGVGASEYLPKDFPELAKRSYSIADAMISAREAKS